MKDLSIATSILSVNYNQEKGVMQLHQRGHINKLPHTFNMSDCNPTSTPMENRLKLKNATANNNRIPYHQAIRKLLYITITSRPNITFSVSYLSHFITCYDKSHWTAIKRLLHYLKGSYNLAIIYHHPATVTQLNFIPISYCNTNWGGNPINHKSVSSYFFALTRGPIMWTSKAQTTVTLSSTKAKYNTISKATKQVIYIRKFFPSLSINKSTPIIIHNNNQSTITITNQQQTTFHSQIKHYNIKLHHIHNSITQGLIILKHKPTNTMPTNILTKALPHIKHNKLLCILQFPV
jgi:hypothetical protein